MVPINIFTPIKGTPYEGIPPISPFGGVEKTIACFSLHSAPAGKLLWAGGRAANLRDAQCMVFGAGASGLMVGNYLTTEKPVRQKRDLQMIKDLGFEPLGK